MVQIVDYKTHQNEDGENFCVLVVQGGLEAVRSKISKRMYFTARTANVACTFNEATCERLIGTDFPGKIVKVDTEPYDYTIPDTGEIVTLSHRYEYVGENPDIVVEDNVVKTEVVA